MEYSWLDLPLLLFSILVSIVMGLSMTMSLTLLFPSLVLTTFRLRFGTVRSESLIAIEEVGVQLNTTYFNGRVDSKFVDKSKIEQIVMNEGITLCRVVFYVAFIMKNEDKMTLAFENLRPSLRTLMKVFRGIRSKMFGETGERAMSSISNKKSTSPLSSSSRRKKKKSLRREGTSSTSMNDKEDGIRKIRRRIFEGDEQ